MRRATHLIRFNDQHQLVLPGTTTWNREVRLCWVTPSGVVICMDTEPDFVLELATIEEKML